LCGFFNLKGLILPYYKVNGHYFLAHPHVHHTSLQYHCRFDNFFETVKHGGPDNSVSTAWQQLSELIFMTQTPSMEHQDKAPRPSQCMQFGNNVGAPTKDTDNTISFDDIADTPIIFNQPMQNFSNNQSVTMVNEGGTASQDSAVLPSVSLDAATSLQGRVCKISRAMAESVSQREFYSRDMMHYMASQAMCEHEYKRLYKSHLNLQERMCHSIAFLAEMMGDIMYLHQALHQPDAREFVEAIIKEINGHIDNNHWKLIPCKEILEDLEVVPSVWVLRHKQDLTMRRVTKHKARLNLHGWKQEFGRNYYNTYVPVIRGLLSNFLLSLAFVMAYPQAPIVRTCTWSFPRASIPSTGIPRITSSSY
jgi:hypothetical protein